MHFDTVNHLIYEKKKPELDRELIENFNPFLTIKCSSFISSDPFYINYINNTLNTYGYLFDNKDDQFKFFENVIVKVGRKNRIKYIKKRSKEPFKKEDDVKIPEFYSKREIDLFRELSK